MLTHVRQVLISVVQLFGNMFLVISLGSQNEIFAFHLLPWNCACFVFHVYACPPSPGFNDFNILVLLTRQRVKLVLSEQSLTHRLWRADPCLLCWPIVVSATLEEFRVVVPLVTRLQAWQTWPLKVELGVVIQLKSFTKPVVSLWRVRLVGQAPRLSGVVVLGFPVNMPFACFEAAVPALSAMSTDVCPGNKLMKSVQG